ncbi:DUF1801 domain-containing protein [Aureivirga sp. CE67]|uniref:DUF1801 domain-containing protein n=1 Tax=Aureivirga sp. CE67 TaxID=1788983 RepID=UPI0018CA4557|nr:DUF1801 domain-containing protein [Aureivirga sp. CE67]
MKENKEVQEYLDKAPNNFKEILLSLRELISKEVENAEENYKWSRPVYTKEKDVCYLTYTKKHVTFGFFEFEKIKTNISLIEGTGKSMRHIKLKNLSDIEDFQIKKILKELIS